MRRRCRRHHHHHHHHHHRHRFIPIYLWHRLWWSFHTSLRGSWLNKWFLSLSHTYVHRWASLSLSSLFSLSLSLSYSLSVFITLFCHSYLNNVVQLLFQFFTRCNLIAFNTMNSVANILFLFLCVQIWCSTETMTKTSKYESLKFQNRCSIHKRVECYYL